MWRFVRGDKTWEIVSLMGDLVGLPPYTIPAVLHNTCVVGLTRLSCSRLSWTGVTVSGSDRNLVHPDLGTRGTVQVEVKFLPDQGNEMT